MDEKIFLDNLTLNSVSIRKQKVAKIEGAEYNVGDPWRKAYLNSERGRQELFNEVAEPYRTAVLTIWGNTSTVTE